MPGVFNPADAGFRGNVDRQFHTSKFWLQGPAQLSESSFDNTFAESSRLQGCDIEEGVVCEERKVYSFSTVFQVSELKWEQFSSFHRLYVFMRASDGLY